MNISLNDGNYVSITEKWNGYDFAVLIQDEQNNVVEEIPAKSYGEAMLIMINIQAGEKIIWKI